MSAPGLNTDPSGTVTSLMKVALLQASGIGVAVGVGTCVGVALGIGLATGGGWVGISSGVEVAVAAAASWVITASTVCAAAVRAGLSPDGCGASPAGRAHATPRAAMSSPPASRNCRLFLIFISSLVPEAPMVAALPVSLAVLAQGFYRLVGFFGMKTQAPSPGFPDPVPPPPRVGRTFRYPASTPGGIVFIHQAM
jgi:hypothetical protein